MLCIKCRQEVPDGPFCCQCGASQTPSKRKRKRGNGQGSVYKRGNTWTASVTVGGYSTLDGKYRQLKNSKGGFRTRTEAINYIPILQKGKEKKSTFASLLKTYYAGAYNKLSRSKQNAYDIAANRWKAIMHLKVQDASLGQLQEVLNREASTYLPRSRYAVCLIAPLQNRHGRADRHSQPGTAAHSAGAG